MHFEYIVVHTIIVFRFAAFLAFLIAAIKLKRSPIWLLAASLFFSLVPVVGGFFTSEIIVLASGPIIRTDFFYVSELSMVLSIVLLSVAGVAFIFEDRIKPSTGSNQQEHVRS